MATQKKMFSGLYFSSTWTYKIYRIIETINCSLKRDDYFTPTGSWALYKEFSFFFNLLFYFIFNVKINKHKTLVHKINFKIKITICLHKNLEM